MTVLGSVSVQTREQFPQPMQSNTFELSPAITAMGSHPPSG